ncbi:hypothetical protein [Pedobacter sp.]|uniref:hypothetical protein n=1 Tax=Pedobacter sp. TaxID=1411316 RepID=UPI002CA068BE|nr:hypothetical protein [Pedobacter sp.]HWW42022.1 hypothetical protein [Pedobacter sp.]
MGRYLRTGIITKFSIPVKSVEELQTKSETSIEEIVNTLVDNPTSFNLDKTGEKYIWTLKPEIVEKDLLPFLEQYYKDMYVNEHPFEEEIEEILTFLKSNPTSSTITTFANENLRTVFHQERRPEKSFATIGQEEIEFDVNKFILSYEGKIVFEFIYGHLKFFQRSIRKIYQQTSLGGGLIIDVSR